MSGLDKAFDVVEQKQKLFQRQINFIYQKVKMSIRTMSMLEVTCIL